MEENARLILRKYFGYDQFRKGQEEIINDVLNGCDTLAIMPTGAGKSICFQVPAMLFPGITLVISPLISLMKDQVDNLNKLGIEAVFINSTLSIDEQREIMTGIVNGKYKLVYIAPERLDSEVFCSVLKSINISFLAVDEAHCVSQWAHDFRPSYSKIASFISKLQRRPVIGAYTATATETVRYDIANLLKLQRPNVHITGFDRKNLFFSVLRGENNDGFILSYLSKHKGSTGIIYTSTRREADRLSHLLSSKKIKTGVYHAGLSEQERTEIQNKFAYDDIDVMVATNAFGMGIDKSNVRFVIHNNLPKNIEAYYQEAGRAGRDGEKSDCILLFQPKDIQLQTYFIEERQLPLDRKDYEYKNLRAMVDYCYTSKCLRKYMLEYFGEVVEKNNCESCGNCCDKSEKVDITIEAQKIFSCVYRSKERYGTNVVAEVLKGSNNKKIISYGLNEISTYGIMKEYKTKIISDMINKLAADGYLNLTVGTYPVLKLTNRALQVLKNNERVFMNVIKIEDQIQKDSELLESLKRLRKSLAVEEKVPPYIIFSDTTLKEVSEYLPLTKNEFLNIKGVGEIKFQRYGHKFMELIKQYSEEKEINKAPVSLLDIKETKTPSHKLSYNLYKSGKSIDEICSIRNLSRQTIEAHFIKCLSEGEDIKVKNFIPEKYIKEIQTVIINNPTEKLKELKDFLPQEIEYFWIKLIRSSLAK
ncbi:MAG: recQ [Clostridiaceae bacterium]|jgi:ATP-dependent DNA helicase RecQ|nr:recQ [Clostridiaceae bacterium]